MVTLINRNMYYVKILFFIKKCQYNVYINNNFGLNLDRYNITLFKKKKLGLN